MSTVKTQGRVFTPSASHNGDVPSEEPPTYAESVSAPSESGRQASRPKYNDNKIQVDDEFHGSSDDNSDASSATLDLAEDDEAAWALDDQAGPDPPSYEDATNVPTEDELVREILSSQHRHALPSTMPSLPCPIIVPQRRPKQGHKGFVRAYAPILQTVGIDQDTFLSFLKNLHRSTRINPWFTAVMVSSTTIDAAPSAVAMAVATAMESEDGPTTTTGRKTNNFLDRMNKELFKPAGCFAFITRYQESDAVEHESGFFGIAAANVDLTTNRIVPKYGSVDGQDLASLTTRLKLFRLASDLTGASSAAPLVFTHGEKETKYPPEEVPEAQAGPSILQSLASGVAALQDHRSQRRQARADRWAHKHEKRRERREERYERRIERHHGRADDNARRLESSCGKPSRHHSADTPIGQTSFGKSGEILHDEEDRQSEISHGRRPRHHSRRNRTQGLSRGVLYLMIVAMPTELELANARAMLQGE